MATYTKEEVAKGIAEIDAMRAKIEALRALANELEARRMLAFKSRGFGDPEEHALAVAIEGCGVEIRRLILLVDEIGSEIFPRYQPE